MYMYDDVFLDRRFVLRNKSLKLFFEVFKVLFVKVILYSYLILKKMNERITDS